MDKLLVGGLSLQLVKWGTASRDGKGLVYLYQRRRRLHLQSGVQGAPPKLIATARMSLAGESSNSDADALPAAIAVKFVLQRGCWFGQSFNVVGNDPLLGGWNPDSAVPMEWSEGHIWTCEVDLPAGKRYEYKFLLKGTGSRLEWQPGPNRWVDAETSSVNSSLTIVGDWDGEASPSPVKAAAERVPLCTQEDTVTVEDVNSVADSSDAIEELVKPAAEQEGIEEPATVVSDPTKAVSPSEGPAAALPNDPSEAAKEPAAVVTDVPAEKADADLHTMDAQSTPPLVKDHLEVIECGETIPGQNSQALPNGKEESTVSGEGTPENTLCVNKEKESDPCLLEDSRGYITFRF